MLTPYDWQESLGNRVEFVEERLRAGIPVCAISLVEGILYFTLGKPQQKIFEIYDAIGIAAVGQQSDIDAIRIAAIDFAHQEGFARSEHDVTGRRIVQAISAPVKQAFGDFATSPYVIKAVLGEAGASPAEDVLYVLEFDGDFRESDRFAIAGSKETALDDLNREVAKLDTTKLDASEAKRKLSEIWKKFALTEVDGATSPDAIAYLVTRKTDSETRFHLVH